MSGGREHADRGAPASREPASNGDILAPLPRSERDACRRIAERAGAVGGRAMIVGGYVRDALLGIPSKDIDIEIYGLSADTVERELSRTFRLDVVGRAFGVFKLKGTPIDVALPRRESKIGPGHRDFRIEGDPGMTPAEAMRRRDFTLNAIGWDLNAEALVDPVRGREDLARRRLRHVSDAFAEDPLRALRGMQFVARFHLEADPATIALCRELTPDDLPPERLFEEWKKLVLQGERISAGLAFLRDIGWTPRFPELDALIDCPQDPEWHPEGDVWTHTGHCMDAFAARREGKAWDDLVVGFAVLCHDMGKPATTRAADDGRIRSPGHDREGGPIARGFLQRLTRHRKLIESVVPLVEQHMRPLELYRQNAGDAAVRRLATKVARLDWLCRVALADKNGRPPETPEGFPEGEWLMQRSEALRVRDNAPAPILKGRHLKHIGLEPGPRFKPILDAAYEAQLDGAFEDVESGLAWVREHCLADEERGKTN